MFLLQYVMSQSLQNFTLPTYFTIGTPQAEAFLMPNITRVIYSPSVKVRTVLTAVYGPFPNRV